MSGLPSGWADANLLDICQPKQWKVISTTELTDSGYVVYGANGKIGFYSTYTHENPTLMITCRGATCGNLHISVPRAYINGNAMALDDLAVQATSISYLKYALQARGLADAITGSAQPQITRQSLSEVKVKLAPLTEQTRIAEKLDELLAQVDTLKARIDAIPALLKRFRQSVLAAAVSGRLTEEWRNANSGIDNELAKLLTQIEKERKLAFQADSERVGRKKKYNPPAPPITEGLPEIPPSWHWVSVDSLASKVVDGVHKKPDYKSSGIPFITVKNLTLTSGISFAETKFVSPEDHKGFYKRANPEYGDILISKDGTLGVVRQVKTDAEFSIFVSVALVKPALRSTSDYLEIAFKSPQVQAQMVGVGTGLQHIHLTDLKQDAIPLPPICEQTEIVRRVEQLFAFADQLESKVTSAKSRIDLLTQSILAKAFRGELVPQDPNDEPASVLLDRIKTQRATAPKAKRGKKATG